MHVQCPHCGAWTDTESGLSEFECPRCHNTTLFSMEETLDYSGQVRIRSEPTPTVDGDRFEVLRELAAGGLGRVYLARDTRVYRIVALKFIAVPGEESSD